ncbi:hypothetical protein LTR74_017738, partial [Friedmanniomyces endolithicus]
IRKARDLAASKEQQKEQDKQDKLDKKEAKKDPNGVCALVWDKALLRVWDRMSRSQPKQDDRTIARASRQRLDTRNARVRALIVYLDQNNATPTPFISFADSPGHLESLALLRKQRGNRGQQFLTVVDP